MNKVRAAGPRCKFCGSLGYKTNGESEWICKDRAFTGSCQGVPGRGSHPAPYKRNHPKIGRNEKCPCGSELKYKNCHGKRN